MTRDLQRFYGGSDLHSLTFSCSQRQPLFNNAARCDLFLTILERVRLRYRLVVLGYVVMPEHVHLLLSEPQRKTLSTAIQALKLGVVRSLEYEVERAVPRSRKSGEALRPGAGQARVNPNLDVGGVVPMSRKPGETWGTPISGTPGVGSSKKPNRFWQARFYDFNVWTEKKRIEKLRYIHRNPVVGGLVASPEQWRWSSFRWYSRGEVGPVRINDTDILVMKIRPPAA